MSRINPASSASGVRVAAQPLSNIYTVLLIVGLLSLILSLVMLWVSLEQRYGVTFAVTDEGKAALAAPTDAAKAQVAYKADLDAKSKAIEAWPAMPGAPWRRRLHRPHRLKRLPYPRRPWHRRPAGLLKAPPRQPRLCRRPRRRRLHRSPPIRLDRSDGLCWRGPSRSLKGGCRGT